MYFIDFHTHVYPDAIASKAADNVRQFYNGLGNPAIDGSVQTLLERGTKAGVEKFVILPVAVQPTRTRSINDFIISQVADQPRFFGYGTIHAAMENITGEISYIMEKGLRGLKMHPDSQVFAIDDDILENEFPALMGEKLYDTIPALQSVPQFDFRDFALVKQEYLELFRQLTEEA